MRGIKIYKLLAIAVLAVMCATLVYLLIPVDLGSTELMSRYTGLGSKSNFRTAISIEAFKSDVEEAVEGVDAASGDWAYPVAFGTYLWGRGVSKDDNGNVKQKHAEGVHRAVDINGMGENAPILASRGGIVTLAEWHYSYGFNVLIDHGEGFTARYCHMVKDSLLVSTDQTVTRGQQLGGAGTSGESTGIHLHFEMTLNGVFIDPEDYIDFRGGVMSAENKP